jgi:hypothetical protein
MTRKHTTKKGKLSEPASPQIMIKALKRNNGQSMGDGNKQPRWQTRHDGSGEIFLGDIKSSISPIIDPPSPELFNGALPTA